MTQEDRKWLWCKHHPLDWYHIIGCPHVPWTEIQLKQAKAAGTPLMGLMKESRDMKFKDDVDLTTGHPQFIEYCPECGWPVFMALTHACATATRIQPNQPLIVVWKQT